MSQRVWILLAALLALAGPAGAFFFGETTNDFGPYRDDEAITQVALTEMGTSESQREANGVTSQKLILEGDPKAPYWVFRQNRMDPKHVTVLELHLPRRKKLLKLKLDGWMAFTVFTADLNGDGKPDYILGLTRVRDPKAVPEETGDEKLESIDYKGFLAVLSDKKAYKAYLVPRADLEDWDFVKVSPAAGTQIILSRDFKEPKLSLARPTQVTFHLYQLLSINGASLSLDNVLDSRFPKIVAQSAGARHKNHKETKLIPADQKKALYRKYAPEITTLRFEK